MSKARTINGCCATVFLHRYHNPANRNQVPEVDLTIRPTPRKATPNVSLLITLCDRLELNTPVFAAC